MHSQGQVSMYKPGDRPAEASNAQQDDPAAAAPAAGAAAPAAQAAAASEPTSPIAAQTA